MIRIFRAIELFVPMERPEDTIEERDEKNRFSAKRGQFDFSYEPSSLKYNMDMTPGRPRGERIPRQPFSLDGITPFAQNITAETLRADITLLGNDIESQEIREFSEADMQKLLKEIADLLKKEDEKKHLPYHNSRHTLEGVLPRTQEALRVLQPPVSIWEQQALQIAAGFHDYKHSGRAIRKADEEMSPEEADAIRAEGGLSNEEVAANAADVFAKEKGLSVKQRVLIYGAIIGTTFGNPTIQPQTRLEKILAVADRAGYASTTNEEWMRESVNVLRERRVAERPQSMLDVLRGQEIFLERFSLFEQAPAELQEKWGDSYREKLAHARGLREHLEQRGLEEDPEDETLRESWRMMREELPPLLQAA